jgi:hypothetical protein
MKHPFLSRSTCSLLGLLTLLTLPLSVQSAVRSGAAPDSVPPRFTVPVDEPAGSLAPCGRREPNSQPIEAYRPGADRSRSTSLDRGPRSVPDAHKGLGYLNGRRRAAYSATAASLPLYFERNEGQTDPRVRFLSRMRNQALLLDPSGMTVKLANRGASPARSAALRIGFAGARPSARIEGMEPRPGRVSYFRGGDASGWAAGIPTYGRVRYCGVYPGTDVEFYGREGRAEYDFLLAPGADPARIRLSVDGARKIELNARGDLLLHTAAGTLTQLRPVAYQQLGGRRSAVAAGYRIASPAHPHRHTPAQVTLALGAYDRSRPLVIDPSLVYSTFLGGGGYDGVRAVAVDANGSAYVAGETLSVDFPTENALQGTKAGAATYDAFVAKLTPSGSDLVYATYLGGGNDDSAGGIALDADGNAYLAGTTASTDFPTTSGAFSRTRGGFTDAFAAKLSASGTALRYSTYLGGARSEDAVAVAVDGAGAAYVGGSTESGDYPVTSGSFSRAHGGFRDGFVTKLNAAGTDLVYSTFLGGGANDRVAGIAVDGTGAAYAAGGTESGNFPVVDGSFGTTRGGLWDAFVAKLRPEGTRLIYSGLLGGAGLDEANAIALDSGGSAFVTGYTGSFSFPTSAGAFDGSFNGGERDAFLTRISADGASRLYSTYLGGSLDDSGIGVAVDGSGLVYVAGGTSSTDFPVQDPLFALIEGGYDAFVCRLNTGKSGSASLLLSTYLGGGFDDAAQGIAVAQDGSAVLAGITFSNDFPRRNAFQDARAGDADGFITRIGALEALGAPSDLTATALSSSSIELAWVDNSGEETGFEIERRSGGEGFERIATVDAGVTRYVDTGLETQTRYTYHVRAIHATGQSDYSNEAEAVTRENLPGAPTNLTATAVSASAIDLTWNDNSAGEEHFEVERRTSGGSFERIAQTAANATSYKDTGLVANTTYVYRVRATSAAGASDYSNEATATTTNVPAAPSNLTAEALGQTQIKLNWDDNSDNEDAFEIERRTGNDDFARIATVAAGVDTFTDTGLDANTRYTYRVRAKRGTSFSDYSNEASATTNSSAPISPTNLTATVLTASRIRLEWIDRSDNEEGFELERAFGGGGFVRVIRTAANVTTYEDKGLTPSTTYTYRVRAFNSGGSSDYSNEATATTLPPPPPPAAPGSLTATAESTTRIRLTWQDTSDVEESIEIERQFDTGYRKIATVDRNITTFTDAALQPNTPYTYRVRAVNAGGRSDYSAEATALTLPRAPTEVGARAKGDDRIKVVWHDANPRPAAHLIERSNNGGASFEEVHAAPPGKEAWLDTGLKPNTVYVYRLRASNASGNSEYSSQARARTHEPVGGKLDVARTLDFGRVQIGSRRTRSLIVRNLSEKERLTVHVGDAPKPFRLVGPEDFTLAAREGIAVRIRFRPRARGKVTRTIVIQSSDPDRTRVTVKLIGTGVR